MDLRRDAELAGAGKQQLRLCGGEQPLLAGEVMERGDALLDDRRQERRHLVGVGVRADPRGHDVRSQERDDQAHRGSLAAACKQLELMQFVLGGQAVARLDLERRDAPGEDPVVARARAA